MFQRHELTSNRENQSPCPIAAALTDVCTSGVSDVPGLPAVSDEFYEYTEPTSMPSSDQRPFVIIVMGVSGCGKSTLGAALATAMREYGDGESFPFVEGDDFHSPSNVKKMEAGTPLTDVDRAPWLRRIREHVQRVAREEAGRPGSGDGDATRGIVVACSALKKKYRDYLRFEGRVVVCDEEAEAEAVDTQDSAVTTLFVFINGSEEVLVQRMAKREGHFMKEGMLKSQMETLEDPRGEEGVVVVRLDMTTEEQVRLALEGFKLQGL